MEKSELKKDRDNKLNLHTFGLKLEVQPYWLVKEMINQNSQNILDELIELAYKEALNKFSVWHTSTIFRIKDGEDENELFEKNKYKVHNQEIQDVADISRELLPLHSDWECIDLDEVQHAAQEIAYSYWKYNNFYGFETTE